MAAWNEEDHPRIQTMVGEFHAAMDVPVLETPQVPSDERVRLRARLIVEEVIEFLEACFGSTDREVLRFIALRIIDGEPVRVNLTDAADALADIAYVVEGTNLEFGIDSQAVLEEVHRANMAKVTGPVRADGKRLKPEGWTPPDVAGVLARQR